MVKTLYSLFLLAVFALVASPAFAQGEGSTGEGENPPATENPEETHDDEVASAGGMLDKFGAAIGSGIVLLGVGFGIARIGGQAVEGMSRQPEAASSIQTAMIISAALIEGAGFFALIICLIALVL